MRFFDPTELNTPTEVDLHPASAFGKASDIMTNGFYPQVVIEGGPIGQLPVAMRTINNMMTPEDITVKALKASAALRSADKTYSSVAFVMNNISKKDIETMTARMAAGQSRILMAEMDAAVVKASGAALSSRALTYR
jgi:hypothetical protein